MRRTLLLFFLGCQPDLGSRDSLLTRPQILAVRGDPPEAAPGVHVRYSLLAFGTTTETARWALCATPKLVTENGVASAACLGDGVRVLGDGAEIDAATPDDACRLFGPDVGSNDFRPRDPDVTGGYYQPIRVSVGSEPVVAFGLERLTCKLGGASIDIASDFGRRYLPNRNPELVAVDLPETIAAGATATLRASWSDTERYVVYDLASRTLVERRETMRVSWFGSAGTFKSDRTGRSADEPETFAENEWTAPSGAQKVELYVVLRDDRGGVSWRARTIDVR